MKRFIQTSAFAAAIILSLCSCLPKKPARTVSVSGSGSVTLEADNATVSLSVITRGKEITEVSSENAKKMTAIQDALVQKGIKKDSISTENFSLRQETSYDRGKTIYGDYVVTNQINIFVKDINLVSDVIDTSLKNGANQLSSLSYGVNDTELAEKQAKILAMQQAQEAARVLAGTAGSKLGKVLSISESNGNYFPKARLMKAEAIDELFSDSVATPVSAGKTTVTVTVDAVFELN